MHRLSRWLRRLTVREAKAAAPDHRRVFAEFAQALSQLVNAVGERR